MTLVGGKRKLNKGLKDWIAFVKKVEKEEKISYREAIHRAKIRKDKGEKWMKGGEGTVVEETFVEQQPTMIVETPTEEESLSVGTTSTMSTSTTGGSRKRTARKGRSVRKSKTARRSKSRSRSSRRH
jgi:hypothetical protein